MLPSGDVSHATVGGLLIGLAAATQLVRSFEGRDFRYLWFSDVLNGWAEQMEFVALGWLVGGVLATVFGNQATLVIAGVLMAGLNLFVYARSREVRRID